MADLQGYSKISQTYKEIVQTLTTKQLSYFKIYLNSLSKQIAAGQDKFLSQFKDLKEMLDTLKQAKGKVPLHYAIACGKQDVVKYLIEELKVDYHVKDKQGNSAFFTAIQHGHLNIVKYLVQELGISPLSTKEGQIGALHIAANINNIPLIQYFLTKGCDIQKVSIYGKPINWAVGSQNIQATKYLLQKNADANGDLTCPAPAPIILAVDFGCSQIYQALLNAPKPANINAKDPQGYSLLHLAAQKGNLNLVKQLIEKGLEVDLQVDGKTPLYLAFENNKWQVVAYLKTLTKNSLEIQKKIANQKQHKTNQQKSVNFDKQKAQLIKAQGNKFFAEKNFQQSLKKYQQALTFNPQNDAIHRNLAACYLSLNNFQKALMHCHEAKKSDAKNIKNLYRQAQAYIGLNNLMEAASSLWQCAMLEPQTPFFRQQFQKYVQLAKQQHKNK